MTRSAAPARETTLSRVAVLIATALAARAVTFGSPLIHADEPFYLTVAQAMSHGALPYVDLWDRKPVGLFLLYLPAAVAGLPASLYLYQAMAAAAVVATALLIARLADRAGWRGGGLPAAMFYILWLDLADGQGGQSPVFYNLAMAAAASLVLIAGERASRHHGCAAMLLVGVALQIKYSVVFEGIGFGLWLLVADWRARRSVGGTVVYAAMLVALALLPTAAAAATYAAMGHLGDFVFANFVSILHRGRDATTLTLSFARDSAAVLSLLAFALAGWRADAADGGEYRARLFLRLWLLVAVSAFVGFGGWYNHYTLPVMLPGSACAAVLLGRRASGKRWAWLWVAVPLALVFVAGQRVLQTERARRGNPAEFAALADAVGRGAGSLFVYSGPVLLYPATGRPAPTRYLFPSHLGFLREAGSLGVDQHAEIERIFARHPAAVVMASPIDEEDPAIRALVVDRLRRSGYRAAPPLPLGGDALVVYRRSVTTPPSPPAAR